MKPEGHGVDSMGGLLNRLKHSCTAPNDEDHATVWMRLRQRGESNIPGHKDRFACEACIEDDMVRR
jgi:hypothetical protein